MGSVISTIVSWVNQAYTYVCDLFKNFDVSKAFESAYDLLEDFISWVKDLWEDVKPVTLTCAAYVLNKLKAITSQIYQAFKLAVEIADSYTIPNEKPEWADKIAKAEKEWQNKMLHHFWPRISGYIRDYIKNSLENQIRRFLGSEFEFEVITIGDKAPCFSDIVFRESSNNRMSIDCKLLYEGNCSLEAKTSYGTIAMKDVKIYGKMSLAIKASEDGKRDELELSFLEDPFIDFTFSGFWGFVANFLRPYILKKVKEQLKATMVHPNNYSMVLGTEKKDVAFVKDLIKSKVSQDIDTESSHNSDDKDDILIKPKIDPYEKATTNYELILSSGHIKFGKLGSVMTNAVFTLGPDGIQGIRRRCYKQTLY